MRGMKVEFVVGVFVIIVLAVLSFMTFKVSDIPWLKKKGGYVVNIYFKNIAGLDEKTKVRVAGVDAGIIEKIELSDERARLGVRIRPGVKLYSDAHASIRAAGLLGDKYLHISPGKTGPPLKDGDTIQNVRELVDIDDLINNISATSARLNKLLTEFTDEEVKDSLRESVFNLRDITRDLKSAINENNTKFQSVLGKVDSLVLRLDDLVRVNSAPLSNTISNFNDFTAALKTDGPELLKSLNKASGDLKALIEENRPAMTSIMNKTDAAMGSIQNLTARVERGEGTIGKIFKDEELYTSLTNAVSGAGKTLSAIERFRTFIQFQGDYLMEESEGKGYFYVTLQPRKDKYYILGVVADPAGRIEVTETTTNGTTRREETRDTDIEFTAQFAKRFEDLTLRIGVTESTFGAGADYFLLNDKLKLSVDAWDFGSDEYKAESPHVRVAADYFLFKHLFLSTGYDNMFNKRRSFFLGGGIRFEDEDFKYIFGSVPRVPGM